MDFIRTKLHGAIDYLIALALIITPFVMDQSYETAAGTYVPLVLGAMLLLISVCTDYNAGFIKVLDMRVHLLFDLGTALVLLTSPWVFGFDKDVSKPYLFMGAALMLVAVVSGISLYANEARLTRLEGEEDYGWTRRAG